MSPGSETRREEITDAYYDDRITDEELTALVGPEAAANIRVLNNS